MTHGPETPPIGNDDSWRHHNVGRLLNAALRNFEQRVLERMVAAGQVRLTRSHINATRHLDLAGTRLTELAQRAAMTKQSMSELVSQIEAMGLVTRDPDPEDTRARIIRFTPQGLAWLEAFRDAVFEAEAEFALVIGVDALKVLKRDLQRYCVGQDDGLAMR